MLYERSAFIKTSIRDRPHKTINYGPCGDHKKNIDYKRAPKIIGNVLH